MTVYRVQPAKSSESSYPKVRPAFDENFIETKTLDPSMTFSRSSGGTYVGPDGLIKIAGVNQPRFDHDPVTGECLGFLVEESKTNLQLYSNSLTTAASPLGYGGGYSQGWMQNSGDITQLSDQFGIYYNTKYNLVWSAYGTCSVAASTIYTVSFFAKSSTVANIRPRLYGNTTGTVSTGTYVSLQTGGTKHHGDWRKFEFVMPSTSNTGNSLIIELSTGSGFDIKNIQVEQGPFATSYIPTNTTSITRAADKPIINRSINSSGTFYVEANTPTTSGVIVSADNSSTSLTIRPTLTGSNRYSLYYNPSKYAQISSSSSVVSTEYSRVLAPFTPSNINRISLGYDEFGGGTSYINGHIGRFTYYSAPVSENIVKSIVGNPTQIFRENTGIVTNGLVLNLDAGNRLSLPLQGYNDGRNWSSGWSGNFGTAGNSFDGNLSTYSANVGGTFFATYTFSPPLNVTGTVRVFAMFGASNAQVAGRTGVITINDNDISSKLAAANAYLSGAWIDVTAEAGSRLNTIILNGTSGSTNPGIAAIEINGQVLVNTTVSPTTWLDVSGSGNNGTMTNGPTYSNANGGSIVFDGSNDFVSLGSFFTYQTFTINLWVNAGNTQGQYADIFDNNHTANQNFVLQQNDLNTNQYSFGVNDASGFISGTTTITLTPNVWTNLTFTFTPSDRVIGYVNGSFHSQGALANGRNIFYSSQNLNLARWGNGGRHWNGRMANFSVYNRVLSAAEIQQNFNTQRGRYGI